MSRIRADKISNKDGTGAVQLQYGAEVPVGYGITGAGTINLNGNIQSANLSGGGAGITNINADNISSGTLAAARVATLNQNTSGTSGGLSGTPSITVADVVANSLDISGSTDIDGHTELDNVNISGIVTAASANFTGNVSIGGTLTYEDVTNIDAVGLITARNGIKVLAGGINAVGVVTATEFVGSGANLTGLPPTAGITTGIAGNTIASGDPVVVNSDGTLSSVEVAGNFGSLTQVATKHPKYLGLKYLTFHSKVIAQWVTDGEDYIYTCFGTVSGDTITWGTVRQSHYSWAIKDCDIAEEPSTGKLVAVFQDYNASQNGKAMVGTVSGDDISWGALQEYDPGGAYDNTVIWDPSTSKFLMLWRDTTDGGKGTAKLGTRSGDSISFTSYVQFSSTYIRDIRVATNGSGKFLICYKDEGNSNRSTAVVGTTSGNSISFGTPVEISSYDNSWSQGGDVIYDSNADKFVIVHDWPDNDGEALSWVATISGTSVTFGAGTPVDTGTYVHNSTTYNNSLAGESLAYDSDRNIVTLIGTTHRHATNSGLTVLYEGTISGTNITWSSSSVIWNGAGSSGNVTNSTASCYDPVNKKIIGAFKRGTENGTGNYSSENYLYSRVYNGQLTNVTNENFIGIAENAYSSGAVASVRSEGGISATVSGLTAGQTYYVQNNGTLGTSPAVPVVKAGVALSASKLSVSPTTPGSTGDLTIFGTSGTDPTLQIQHSAADVNGEFTRIARTDLPTIRYHSIQAAHGGASTANYIKYLVHNGSTTTSQTEVLKIGGDGKVTLGENGKVLVSNSGIHIGPGVLAEKVHVDSGGGITGTYNHNVLTYGMMWYGSSNAAGTWTFNIRGSGSISFDTLMSVGETTTMTMIAGNNNTANYMIAFQIQGVTQTVEWAGGTAPSAGTGSGYDSYVVTIIKLGSNSYKCFGNFTNFN
tara:strand:+ start:716 stop:3511 length:2796 start_codon:yes stop_codon:yes gene_type:complete